MNRTLLAILCGVLLVSAFVYEWTRTTTPPETAIEIPWEPVNVAAPASVESSVPAIPDTDEAPVPKSVNQQKFESADETEDTADGVTIEVEPEEE
jgi:hypothetical protein